MPHEIIDEQRGALVSIYTLASTLGISVSAAEELCRSGRLRILETGIMTWIERSSMLEYLRSDEFKKVKEADDEA